MAEKQRCFPSALCLGASNARARSSAAKHAANGIRVPHGCRMCLGDRKVRRWAKSATLHASEKGT